MHDGDFWWRALSPNVCSLSLLHAVDRRKDVDCASHASTRSAKLRLTSPFRFHLDSTGLPTLWSVYHKRQTSKIELFPEDFKLEILKPPNSGVNLGFSCKFERASTCCFCKLQPMHFSPSCWWGITQESHASIRVRPDISVAPDRRCFLVSRINSTHHVTTDTQSSPCQGLLPHIPIRGRENSRRPTNNCRWRSDPRAPVPAGARRKP